MDGISEIQAVDFTPKVLNNQIKMAQMRLISGKCKAKTTKPLFKTSEKHETFGEFGGDCFS